MDINYLVLFCLVILGLCLGSFAAASVWRLRAMQLRDDKKNGEEYDKKEYSDLKKLLKKGFKNDHSVCLHCSYRLKWYDLVPLISWMSIGGKCRKCRKSIGFFEPLSEIGVALFFAISYIFWPNSLIGFSNIALFTIWLIAGVALAVLFAYDAKWSLLPDSINFTLVLLGLLSSAIFLTESIGLASGISSILLSILVLSGLYLFLYIISKGRWIGFGDIKLGLGLALMLSDWRLAIVALFMANFIGCLIVVPGMLVGKISRNSHIPFGPLLILGLFIAKLFGLDLIDSYLSIIV